MLLKEWQSLPKYMKFSCLMGFLFVDVLNGHIVSMIKRAYEDLEHVNGKNVYVRKEDQTVKRVYKVREFYFFP